ncbi:beta-ketoacyl synthase N-terminal-like domain-containing protein [Streptomyces sp. NPDC002088]|uniref:type I polyketide synthase n=1 Tax=Streptomyces sp. NPDC002088 TaxID=3154665 RepID=UPI00331A248D
MTHRADDIKDCDVAIVGMACRLPGADSVDAFWRNLRGGRESTTFFSDEELLAAGLTEEELSRPGYVKAGQILPDIELFDAEHFRIPADEAEILDPQHRHFLECSLTALEDAGYAPATYPGEIGVFAGAGMNTYLLDNLADRYADGSSVNRYRLMLANDKDFLATRVSYKLDLRGPSLSVNTACSTSLVAVHLACLSLLAGECGLALAGAVHLRVPQYEGYLHQEGMIFSPDGHCRAFDADAQGTVIGSGVGVVVLKRLSDAVADGDTIHAVIKGTAINNDGSTKPGYTAPSVERQAAVIREAQRVADCPPETISYVEAHGTGTPLGDPIEVAALTEAFGGGRTKEDSPRTLLGSVKTNIGHLDTAAGMAGLIKTALMLRHRTLVPSLHFRTPNPDIDFTAGPFTVGTGTATWPAGPGPRRAGVSSFGVGGTNAHAVLQEPPPAPAAAPGRAAELLVLSARTPEALSRATGELARHLRHHPGLDLTAVAHTLAVGRGHHVHRRAVVCTDLKDAALSLAVLDPGRVRTGSGEEGTARFALVFPGGGSEPVPGALDLYRELAVFRDAVASCATALDTGRAPDPEALLTGGEGAHIAAFTTQYALARVCREWNVRPGALVGSGPGQAVAGCLAGVLDLRAALTLVAGGELGSRRLPEPGLPLSLGSGRDWLPSHQAAAPRTWSRSSAAGIDHQATAALLKDAGLVAIDLDVFGRAGTCVTEVLLHALAEAWTCGAQVDWSAWYAPGRRRRVGLPTYPFERRRHWAEPIARRSATTPRAPEPDSGTLRRRIETVAGPERSALLQEFLRLQVADILEQDDGELPGVDENLFHLGVDSLILIDVIARLGTELGSAVNPSFDDAPTIRGLADQVARALSTEATTTGRNG